MLRKLKKIIEHPLTKDMDPDAAETTAMRSRIISEKLFLQQIYQKWYHQILQQIKNRESVLEIGSGGGFLKQILPAALCSEVFMIPKADIVLDAQYLPFKKNSIHHIVMLDVFHHIPNAEFFFTEAGRCIPSGGSIIMIEPWMTPWSRLIYRYLHHEPVDMKAESWVLPEGGPLSAANSALPWIVFDRDIDVFYKKYPQWHVKQIIPHSPFVYLLSGGVSLRNMIPGYLFPFFEKAENILNVMIHQCAMFATIVLIRK